MLRMGEYYLYDYDSLNGSEKGFCLFQKKAAEYGVVWSEGLGICYEMGIGVGKIMKRKLLNIIRWLRIMEIR